MNDYKVTLPSYFYREYENDFPKQDSKNEPTSQTLRVVKVALPFVSLYRPVGRVLAGGLGSIRTITNFRQCLSAEDYQNLSWSILQTGLALVSVTGTIFLHPMGMLITTFGDIAENSHGIYCALTEGEISTATKQTMRVANNSLYLALMLSGSVQLQLASLALQVLIEGSSSMEEFNKGNMLETIGHLGMCMVRMNQSYAELGTFQRHLSHRQVLHQNSMKAIAGKQSAKMQAEERTKHLEFSLSRAEQSNYDPALKQLEEQYPEELFQRDGSFPEHFQYFKDASGYWKAVWFCEDQDWNFSIRSAFYNAETNIWTKPENQPLDLLSHFSFGSEIRGFDREDVFLKFKMNSLGNLTAMCVFPGEILDQWEGEGLLQVATFDLVKNVWTFSPLIEISCFPIFPENALADLQYDQYGNIAAIWYDSGPKSLKSIHYEINKNFWSPIQTIDSGINVDEIHLIPSPTGEMIAIWKEKLIIQDPILKEEVPIKDVIRSSSYNLIEKSWNSPFDIIKSDSLRLRSIGNLQFQIDTLGNIIMVWEEQPETSIFEIFQFVQVAKKYPEELKDWLLGNYDDEYEYKEGLALIDFLDSIHSFEDYLRKMMNYKGSISVKEFLKQNDPHGDYSVSGSVFDAKTKSWSNPMVFSSHGHSPKIVKLDSGKVFVYWLSHGDSSSAEKREKLIDQYTDQEIEDIMFGRKHEDELDMDDDWMEENEEEYLQCGLYDPMTKTWKLDPSRFSSEDEIISRAYGNTPLRK